MPFVIKEYFPSDYTYHVEKMEVDPEDYRNFECTIRIMCVKLPPVADDWYSVSECWIFNDSGGSS
jgi:hypothetical protein